jgi:hypothetical protein
VVRRHHVLLLARRDSWHGYLIKWRVGPKPGQLSDRAWKDELESLVPAEARGLSGPV